MCDTQGMSIEATQEGQLVGPHAVLHVASG